METGTSFLSTLTALRSYGAYFNWLCEGNTAGIVLMSDKISKTEDAWYTLDGCNLNGKPSQKDIYIHHGKKQSSNNDIT